MKKFSITALTVGVYISSAVVAAAQSSIPIYDAMGASEKGEKYSEERTKLCLLAVKTYDYGVKELGLDSADSKKALRAEKALPFVTLDLESKTQTGLLFDRAVADVTAEFSIFKAADKKAQKKFFSAAKGVNKSCSKRYQNSELDKYGRLTDAANFVPPMSSEDALICANVTWSGLKADRSTFRTGFVQYMTWHDVYEDSVRREGHPADELVEKLTVDDMEARAKEVDSAKSIAMFETCPAIYKKARFQADLKKDEPAVVPVINW